MFKYKVGSVVCLYGKLFTIKRRTWKETIDYIDISYDCIDEVKDIHKFNEKTILRDIEEMKISND